MTKKIISQTILFSIVMSFIIMFKSVFGDDNTLIGVSTITAILMFLERDLTISPLKNLSKLLGINVLMGIGAYIASNNMYLGIPINFAIVFLIHYMFNYTLLKPMYLPFSLQYLFILSYPVEYSQVGTRLIALASGAIFIMLSQIIINRQKLTTSGDKITLRMCNLILDEIKNDNNKEELNEEVKILTNSLKKIIYEKRESNYYLTQEGRLKLSMVTVLERINIIVNQTENQEINPEVLKDLENVVSVIRDLIERKEGNIKRKEILDKYKNEKLEMIDLKILENITILIDVLEELTTQDTKNANIIQKVGKIPSRYKEEVNAYFNLKRRTMKYSYAMRMSLAITIGSFVVSYFELTEGRWMLFTIASLVNPIYEVSNDKTKDRIISTIIGSVVVMILFSIIKDTTTRSLVLMLSGYLSGYTTSYKQNMFFVTISSIGAAAVLDNIGILSISRVMFVVYGAVLSVLINKYIFPYKMEDANEDLEGLYIDTVKNMISEISYLSKDEAERDNMKNLLIRSSLIQERLKLNNGLVKTETYITQERRFLVLNVYGLYMFLLNVELDNVNISNCLNKIISVENYNNENINKQKALILEKIEIEKDLNTKIALNSIYEILHDLGEII